MNSEESPCEEEKKDHNDEAGELDRNVRMFNHCKIDSETDTEESEDNYRTEKEAESNEKRRRFVKFKSSSEEEEIDVIFH